MKRILTGLILGAIWIGVIVSGSPLLFGVMTAVVAGMALYEYYRITLGADAPAILSSGIVMGLLPLPAALIGGIELMVAVFIMTLLAGSLVLFTAYSRSDAPFDTATRLCAGTTYIGLLAAHLPLLMALPGGKAWLLILTAITICSDTGAYYTGVNLGRRKLCPAISPGKTIEGLAGGVAAAVVAAVITGHFLLPEKPAPKIALLAVMVTLVGVCGDLMESIMKRGNEVKDSGRILPGHGGMLDRVDSMLASAPALYYAVHFGLV